MKKHLITGITGQDGIFLTSEILNSNENIKIIGISRNKNTKTFYENLSKINSKNLDFVEIVDLDLNNLNKVENFLKDVQPDVIYNLAGPSSPYESIQKPPLSFQHLIQAYLLYLFLFLIFHIISLAEK